MFILIKVWSAHVTWEVDIIFKYLIKIDSKNDSNSWLLDDIKMPESYSFLYTKWRDDQWK